MRIDGCSKCGAHYTEPCWCDENSKLDKIQQSETDYGPWLNDANERWLNSPERNMKKLPKPSEVEKRIAEAFQVGYVKGQVEVESLKAEIEKYKSPHNVNISSSEYAELLSKESECKSLKAEITKRDELLRECCAYTPFEGRLRGRIEVILKENNNEENNK